MQTPLLSAHPRHLPVSMRAVWVAEDTCPQSPPRLLGPSIPPHPVLKAQLLCLGPKGGCRPFSQIPSQVGGACKV